MEKTRKDRLMQLKRLQQEKKAKIFDIATSKRKSHSPQPKTRAHDNFLTEINPMK
jgi:hypothetical protein